jgi:hypothetical protein
MAKCYGEFYAGRVLVSYMEVHVNNLEAVSSMMWNAKKDTKAAVDIIQMEGDGRPSGESRRRGRMYYALEETTARRRGKMVAHMATPAPCCNAVRQRTLGIWTSLVRNPLE